MVKDHKDKFECLSRLSRVGFWELNIVTGDLWWSDEIYKLFEVDKTKSKGTYEAFLKAIHPEDKLKVNDAYQKSLIDKLQYTISHRLLKKNGAIIYVEENCETIFNKKGEPLISKGTVQNITERFVTQNKLLKVSTGLTKLVDNVSDVIIKINSNFVVTFCNEQAKILLGYEPQELFNESINILIPKNIDERHKVYLKKYFSAPFSRSISNTQSNFICLKKDGSNINVNIFFGGMITEDEALFFIKDNTAGYKKEQKIKKELKESREFIRNFGHEIKTPIFGIIGHADQLLNDENLVLGTYRAVHLIRNKAFNLLRQNLNIINLNCISKKNFKVNLTKINLNSLIKNEFSEFKFNAIDNNINLILKVEPNDIYVNSDLTILNSIISNVLDNAIKYSKDNEVVVSVKSKNNNVHLSIKDYGVGMASRDITYFNNDLLTDKLVERDKSLKGLGLGLTFVKESRKLLNLKVVFKANNTNGTNVEFTLPKAINNNGIDQLFNSSTSVLIVDDIRVNSDFLRLMLKPITLNTTVVTDGIKAIEKYKSNNFDLILMDIQMPNMNGVEAMNKIKSINPSQIIIAVTADGLLFGRESYLDAGFDGFISKPYNKIKLFTEIENALNVVV